MERFTTFDGECPPHGPQYGTVIEHVLPEDYRWPNATVPYNYDGTFDPVQLANIREAMETLSHRTCLRFKERTFEDRYLTITNTPDDGCWADTGRQQHGPTYANLAATCTKRSGTILHELLHVLGFPHQHARPDRDHHVCVWYEHILPQPAALYSYEIVRPWPKLAFPLPYDFESIMHYTPDMYSIAAGQLSTLTARHPWNVAAVGQREQLTDYDVLGIQFLYCV
ncbi:bone morphogenetic protein 1-like [Anopheles nili]|uniref:bone morphogenetic protein 1-like n=1 Tax=Anopheles nili TaxID=185578 RepID=UPI00237BEB9B|nr:bone morphogenetic protein 1-like [Anopheles nili]